MTDEITVEQTVIVEDQQEDIVTGDIVLFPRTTVKHCDKEDDPDSDEEDDEECEDSIQYQPHANVAMVSHQKLGKDFKDTIITCSTLATR